MFVFECFEIEVDKSVELSCFSCTYDNRDLGKMNQVKRNACHNQRRKNILNKVRSREERAAI